LATMLENTTTKRSVQEMAVAALAATAVAAEEEFVPYVAGVAAFMVPRMAIRTEALYALRGRALECMGHMAIAVGKEHFRPYFAITMQCAMEGLTLDSTELQEFAYAVFANLAKVMGEEFAPVLSDLVPFLIQVIEQDEGQFERRTDDNKADGFTGLDDSDNDDDEDDEEGNLVLHVRTALLEVKKGAITALGEMAAHSGTAFCPYIESSMQVMQKAASNWHPLIKTEAADAMASFVVPSIAAYHNGAIEWKKGDVTGTHHGPPLSQHTATIAHAVLLEEIALMKDDESATVAKACEAAQSVIEICGPVVVMPVLNELLSATHELLIQVAPCQSNDAQLYDTGHGEVDDDDHDATTQAACDLVGALGRVLGSQGMGPYMPQFLPPIKDYAKSSRPTADRAMAIGCLGEIAQEFDDDLGVSILEQNWSTIFLPCIISTLPDRENDHVQRNAAFCAGVCAEALRDRISMQDCQTLLQHLGPLFTERKAPGTATESAMACVDNAAAAVARIIMSCPSTYVPLGQVLPVLLSALPLQTDMTENETVYNCLLKLLPMMNTNADVQANRNDLQRVLTQACQADSNVEEELREKIRASLLALFAQ
jgi:importin-4